MCVCCLDYITSFAYSYIILYGHMSKCFILVISLNKQSSHLLTGKCSLFDTDIRNNVKYFSTKPVCTTFTKSCTETLTTDK